MRKRIVLFLVASLSCFSVSAQNNPVIQERLKVFIDCHSGCDMTFIRSEINLVDFLLDRQAADVHVLITDQNTGGGGDEYQLIFFGQNQFAHMRDTIYFDNDANNTDFEERDLLVKYLKLGLAPYIARTKMAKDIQIQMKTDKKDADSKENSGTATKDPWNYWVFRVGANGSMNVDEVYKESRLSGNLSANRVTEETKIGFELHGGKNKSNFEYEDDNGNITSYINKNNNYEFSHYYVKSINPNWSWAYEANASRSTFSNNKFRGLFRTGIEYNIFPYKLVNTKSFTIRYIADVRRNNYIDTTLYDKTSETLFGHAVEGTLSVNQKWGTISFGTEYHNYFHNWKFFNLEVNIELDIRITGGLSFNMYSSAQLTRDQLYLPKEGATPQEVLTRRRQLASGYSFFTHFGINYRFGSKLNNFVNPRFD
ncbi:MAG: hypothetical protein ACT4OJ_05840 [Bacteroidota bacterium]